MGNDSQVTCPECQTTQSAEAPFCENCGYRIRRSDTVKEGHGAVTAEMLAKARRRAGRARPKEAPSYEPAQQADEADAEPAQARSGSGPGESDPSTYVEGLRAVRDDDLQADGPAESAQRASNTATMERPAAQSQSGRTIILSAVWLSLTTVAVLATYFITLNAAQHDGESSAPADVPARVDIAAGPYLRGLDDEVRSFILQMCQRVKDDPKEECKQDKLLEGEFPQKSVELPKYAIDATEVTVADYEACVDQGGCEPIDYKDCAVWTNQGLQISLRVPKALQEPHKPVVCVDRAQAKAYCEFAGGRLPSPDQWEKAARGTKGKLFPWGTSWSSDIANWGEMDIAQNPIVGKLDGFEWTAPPASYPNGKSPFGVYDMAGNVAEWVDTGKDLHASARGGSWISHPFDLRTTYRQELDPDATRTDVGFRCAYE